MVETKTAIHSQQSYDKLNPKPANVENMLSS